MQKNVNEHSRDRNKLPNYVLVKYVFDNDVIDMLVFIVLRYHRKFVDLKKNQKNNIFKDNLIEEFGQKQT